MNSRWLTMLVLCTSLGLSTLANAEPAREIARRAQIAGARGDWNTAAQALEELVAAGINSSDVLFNLGTAYANAGRYGEALWRLEQVSQRSVFASEVRHNIRVTRVLLARRDASREGRAIVESALPLRRALAELLPRDHAVVLTLALQTLALVSLLLWRRRSSHEVTRVAYALGSFLPGAASLFTTAVVIAQLSLAPSAVVLHDKLHLLQGPTADAIPDAPIREGTRVEILSTDGAFARVRTFDGKAGWIAVRDIGRIDG